jgi:DNA-binding IclR family transcriptional regulator
MPTIDEVVEALKELERLYGKSPSVADIAQQAMVSPATAHKYLRLAAENGMIVQRDGKFMTKEVARAFGKK